MAPDFCSTKSQAADLLTPVSWTHWISVVILLALDLLFRFLEGFESYVVTEKSL